MWRAILPGGLWLLAIGVSVVETVRAESVVQVRPSRVIGLDPEPTAQKAPVVSTVAIDPQGKLLVTAGDDHLARIWDARTGQLVARLVGHRDWVRAAAFRPDGAILATAGNDRAILLWDTTGIRPYRVLAEQVDGICALAFSPDGRLLAAGGFEGRVRLYDAATAELLHCLEAPARDIRALAFSPDGRHLAAAGRGGPIRIWNTAEGRPRLDLLGHRLRVNALAYCPEGTRLASAGDERTVKIFDTTTGRLLSALPPRPGKILSLVYWGPERIVVGASDNSVRVWDLATNKEMYLLAGHTGSVSALAWDARADLLISGSFDTTVRIWRLQPAAASVVSQPEVHPEATQPASTLQPHGTTAP